MTTQTITTDTDLTSLGLGLTVNELRAIIDERRFSDEFKALVATRDDLRIKKENLDAEIEKVKDLIKATERTATGKPRRTGEIPQDEIDRAWASITTLKDRKRDMGREFKSLHYALIIAKGKLEEYKDETAAYVVRLNELLGDPGVAFVGDTLGRCKAVASYPSGSKEWLEVRQGGIGGSDVGAMLRVDHDHAYENYLEFLKSKTETYSEEELEAQAAAHEGFTGPTGRGNAWELEIVRMFEAKHKGEPDMQVMYSKASWEHKDDPRIKANVDGLLTTDGVTPDGILEIKTASDVRHWYDESMLEYGLSPEIVPPGYRAQVLWYLNAFGFERAVIVALVDDMTFVERTINRYDDIDPTPMLDKKGNPIFDTETGRYVPRFGPLDEDTLAVIDRIWNDEVEVRKSPDYEKPVKNLKGRFTRSFLNLNFRQTAHNLAGWAGIEEDEARELVQHAIDHSANDDMRDYNIVALFQNYANHCEKDRVYVDIETNGSSPRMGDIIQLGLIRVNAQGEIVAEINKNYGLIDDETLKYVGTGFEELHHIYPEDIAGLEPFDTPENIAEVAEHLMDPDVVVIAHNEQYERAWFSQYIPGYEETHSIFSTKVYHERPAHELIWGNPISTMDTMFLSKMLLHTVENNKLEQFAEGNGIPYVDAHNAYKDTLMTYQAETKFKNLLLSMPRGVRPGEDEETLEIKLSLSK